MSSCARAWMCVGRWCFARHTSKISRLAGLAHRAQIIRTFTSPAVDSNFELKSLVDDLTVLRVNGDDNAGVADELKAVRNAKTDAFLKATFGKLARPLSAKVASEVLLSFSAFAFQGNLEMETVNYLHNVVIPEVEQALRQGLTAECVLEALTALISLDIRAGTLYEFLMDSLRSSLVTSLPTVPFRYLIALMAAVRTHQVVLPEDVKRVLNETIELRTSEVTTPAEAISLLINVDISPTWLDKLLDHTSELLPLMNLGELVSLVSILAKAGRRKLDTLPHIAAAFAANPNRLTVNQLSTLAQAVATLSFTDGRVLRRLANDTVANMDSFRRWSNVSTICFSFAKIRFSHQKAWKALASWINDNSRNASPKILSMAVSSFAVSGDPALVHGAAMKLSKVLDVSNASSSYTWLNSVYSLAVCGTLNARLAETVLRKDFVEQFANEEILIKKVNALCKVAQVQAYVSYRLDSYHGPQIQLNDLLPPEKAVDDAALLGKSGRREAYDATCFHSVLYKIAPLNTHATPPKLNGDGVFIDAVVQLDNRKRFVAVKDFDHSKPKLAVLYMGQRQKTITCEDEDEPRFLGSVSLGLSLVESAGYIPVIFTDTELMAHSFLSQKVEFIKTKLCEAVDSHSS